MGFTYTGDRFAQKGDIILLGDKRYIIRRKGTTAMSVDRYYWFDAVWDWFTKRGKR